jgi:L-alanine-DL-glutamate epimerase-like enolase superfamily enzyme
MVSLFVFRPQFVWAEQATVSALALRPPSRYTPPVNLRVCEADLHLHNLHTRMPFKYGIATMTHVPMAFVRVALEVNGRAPVLGVAADLLPPKWFTKDPAREVLDEIHEMLDVIETAMETAEEQNAPGVFDLWLHLYDSQTAWATAENKPPLLAHFGTSLVERAVMDAFCRATAKPFHRALLDNDFGIRLGELRPELEGFSPAKWLPARPHHEIIARHTVGLSDPLTDEDITREDQLNDGLPQSLTASIRVYGLRHFKLKVNGDPAHDLDRLRRIAAVLRAECGEDFAFTLDGNEQFKSFAGFREFWEALRADESLKPFLTKLLFVEQPLHRSLALHKDAAAALADWPDRPPFIIDESDGELDSLPAALALGYDGTSHKNCKGVIKGVANRCLLAHRQEQSPARPFLMSGEDLCNVGPVALLQDLAVCAALGIKSVERNGHHYNAGLSQFPRGVQEDTCAHTSTSTIPAPPAGRR